MSNASPFWTSTLQDLSIDIKSATSHWDLTPQISLWSFGSPFGTPTLINSQRGSSLGSVRVHSLTFSGLFALPRACDVTTGSTSRPATSQPPYLGRKPNARVATPTQNNEEQHRPKLEWSGAQPTPHHRKARQKKEPGLKSKNLQRRPRHPGPNFSSSPSDETARKLRKRKRAWIRSLARQTGATVETLEPGAKMTCWKDGPFKDERSTNSSSPHLGRMHAQPPLEPRNLSQPRAEKERNFTQRYILPTSPL
jgi:hypothetical protein